MAAKYQQLASILRSEVQQILRQGGSRLATEAELSERYHMSRQTVRHALKLLAEEHLIERRQGSGSYIRAQSRPEGTQQIAVITTFLDDYIFPSILHDVQSVFSQAGYSTLVYATENRVSREREILLTLLEKSVSAVLVEGSKTALPTPNGDLYHRLQAKQIPVLFLHGIYGNLPGFPCLQDDNYAGGYQLGQYLAEQGHSRIAGFFKSDDIQGPQRYYGLISALRDAAIPINDDAFFWYDSLDRTALTGNESGTRMDEFIRTRLGASTAVVCYNDEIAHGLIKRLTELSRSVPEEVAVVSFDNSFYSQVGPVPITSLGHRTGHTGRLAAGMLLDILSGKPVTPPPLEWTLFRRQSG